MFIAGVPEQVMLWLFAQGYEIARVNANNTYDLQSPDLEIDDDYQ